MLHIHFDSFSSEVVFSAEHSCTIHKFVYGIGSWVGPNLESEDTYLQASWPDLAKFRHLR